MHLLNLSSHAALSYECFVPENPIINQIKCMKSSFSDLLTLLNERTIYQRCIKVLMTEVFKYLNGLSPDLINEVFRLKSSYHNLRNFNKFETYILKTKSSLNSYVHRANRLWQLVPHEVRKSMSLTQFKSKISK